VKEKNKTVLQWGQGTEPVWPGVVSPLILQVVRGSPAGEAC